MPPPPLPGQRAPLLPNCVQYKNGKGCFDTTRSCFHPNVCDLKEHATVKIPEEVLVQVIAHADAQGPMAAIDVDVVTAPGKLQREEDNPSPPPSHKGYKSANHGQARPGSVAALEEEVRTEELRAPLLQARARMARIVSPDLRFAAAAATPTPPPLPTRQRLASREPQPQPRPQLSRALTSCQCHRSLIRINSWIRSSGLSSRLRSWQCSRKAPKRS
jgi:hypothetical protein